MAETENTTNLRGIRRRGNFFQVDYTVGGKRFRRSVRAASIEDAAVVRDQLAAAEGRRKEHARTRRRCLDPFRPTGGWFLAYMSKTRKNAVARAIDFDITVEQVEAIYRAQRGRCAVTGIVFCEDDAPHWRTRPFFPSLDRIDNALGYSPENVRWVCAATNIALNDFGEGVFKMLALSYAARHLDHQMTLSDL